MKKLAAKLATDSLVDEFVGYVSSSGLEPTFPKDLPEELRGAGAEYGMFE